MTTKLRQRPSKAVPFRLPSSAVCNPVRLQFDDKGRATDGLCKDCADASAGVASPIENTR